MTEVQKKHCSHCDRLIDGDARICPFCAADPDSGRLEDQDEREIVRESLHAKRKKESALGEMYRENRQIIWILALFVGIGALLAVTAMMSGGPGREVEAVPLNELTSLPGESDEEGRVLEMPEPEFSVPGNPSTFETWVTEQGEVEPTPEELEAAEQEKRRRAAAAAAARRAAEAEREAAQAREQAAEPAAESSEARSSTTSEGDQ